MRHSASSIVHLASSVSLVPDLAKIQKGLRSSLQVREKNLGYVAHPETHAAKRSGACAKKPCDSPSYFGRDILVLFTDV